MSCSFLTRFLPRRPREAGPADRRRSQPQPPDITLFTVVLPRTPATNRFDLDQESQTATMASPEEPATLEIITPPHKKIKTEQPPAPKTVCRICYTSLDEKPHSTPCRTCKDTQCYDCLRTQMVTALRDHERMPARCCERVMYPDVGRGIMTPVELETYKLKYDELSTTNPFYCPVPTCSTFIHPRVLKTVHGRVTCHICSTVSCVKCKKVATTDHTCLGDDERAAILKSFKYKLCPKCGTGIMRMYGCPHVRCQCGAHWCWDCQRPMNACHRKPCRAAWREEDTYDPHDWEAREDTDDEETIANMRLPDMPEEHSTAATNNAEVAVRPTDESDGPTAPITTNQPEENQAAPTAQPVVNLDDPDEHDWEGDDFNFGDEPLEEQWDIFGCVHRFREVTKDMVPVNWMVGLDLDKDLDVECMQCLRPVRIVEKEEKKIAVANKAEVAVQPSLEATVPAQLETAPCEASTTAEKESKQSKKLRKDGAFDCSGCGVIYCWWCRRSALRRLAKYRTQTQIR